MDERTQITGAVVVVLVGLLLLFLLLRFVMCWYWKINRRIALLEKQNSLLESQLETLSRISDQLSRVEPHREGE